MARRGGTLTRYVRDGRLFVFRRDSAHRACILAQRDESSLRSALDGPADLSEALWYTPAPGDAAREAAQHAWLDGVLTRTTNGERQ